MKQWKTEKGLTLVEVLAALVILGIVFIGIMTVFPQMTTFNAKTEVKLDTMNLARQEMASLLLASKWEKILETSATDPNSLEPEFLSLDSIDDELSNLNYSKLPAESLDNLPYTADSFVRYQRDGDYRYVADIYLQCEAFLLKEQTTSGPGTKVQCVQKDRVKLYKVHLKVFSNKTSPDGTYRLSSETYSYIRYAAKKIPLVTEGG